jgi:hypothetical protein
MTLSRAIATTPSPQDAITIEMTGELVCEEAALDPSLRDRCSISFHIIVKYINL